MLEIKLTYDNTVQLNLNKSKLVNTSDFIAESGQGTIKFESAN